MRRINGITVSRNCWQLYKKAVLTTKEYCPQWDVCTIKFLEMLTTNQKIPFHSVDGAHIGKQFLYYPKTNLVVLDDTKNEIIKEWKKDCFSALEIAMLNASALEEDSVIVDSKGVIKTLGGKTVGNLNLLKSGFQIIIDGLKQDNTEIEATIINKMLFLSW